MKEAPLAAGAVLRRLQLSLNTPVVSIDELLVGPAAACIALYGQPGSLKLVLALRSVRSGQVAFFSPEASGALADVDLAIEAATGFAEPMGFLFDDALTADSGDPRAVSRAWHGFLAEPEPPEQALAQSAPPLLLSKFRFQRMPSARAGHWSVSPASEHARG